MDDRQNASESGHIPSSGVAMTASVGKITSSGCMVHGYICKMQSMKQYFILKMQYKEKIRKGVYRLYGSLAAQSIVLYRAITFYS